MTEVHNLRKLYYDEGKNITQMDKQQEIFDLWHNFHSIYGHSGKLPPDFDVGKLSDISVTFSHI